MPTDKRCDSLERSGNGSFRSATYVAAGGPHGQGLHVLARPPSRKASLARSDRHPSSGSASNAAADTALEAVAASEGRSGADASVQRALCHKWSHTMSSKERGADALGEDDVPRSPSPLAMTSFSAPSSRARSPRRLHTQQSLSMLYDSPRARVMAMAAQEAPEVLDEEQLLNELHVLKHTLSQLQSRLLNAQRDLAIQELSGVPLP
jgi:hypothetical protein